MNHIIYEKPVLTWWQKIKAMWSLQEIYTEGYTENFRNGEYEKEKAEELEKIKTKNQEVQSEQRIQKGSTENNEV